MTEIAWYRTAITLPLVAPVVSAAVWFILDETIIPPGTHLSSAGVLAMSLAIVLVFSGVFGGLPYAFFAIVVLAILWRRPPKSWRRTAVCAPVLFLPLLLAFLWFVFPRLVDAETPHVSATEARVFVMFAGFGLAVGYSYVAIALAIGSWCRRQARQRAA